MLWLVELVLQLQLQYLLLSSTYDTYESTVQSKMIVAFESQVREVASPEERGIHRIPQNRAEGLQVWEGHIRSFLAINLFVKMLVKFFTN
jgi:hypothetical protein